MNYEVLIPHFMLVRRHKFEGLVKHKNIINELFSHPRTLFLSNMHLRNLPSPERAITDNGANLNNKMITELCTQFKIKHHNSEVATW